jgi:hypothetical protein
MSQETYSKMGNKVVDEFTTDSNYFVVYGCWDKGTPIGEYEFYDVYQKQGGHLICINEGEPFWEKPNLGEIEEFVNQ